MRGHLPWLAAQQAGVLQGPPHNCLADIVADVAQEVQVGGTRHLARQLRRQAHWVSGWVGGRAERGGCEALQAVIGAWMV